MQQFCIDSIDSYRVCADQSFLYTSFNLVDVAVGERLGGVWLEQSLFHARTLIDLSRAHNHYKNQNSVLFGVFVSFYVSFLIFI